MLKKVAFFGITILTFLPAVETTAQDARRQAGEAVREIIREKLKIPEADFARLLAGENPGVRHRPLPDASVNAPDETTVSGDPLPESEVHALINPADPSNIVVSAMRLNSGNPQEALLCPIYVSKDFGRTWMKSSFRNLPTEPGAMVAGGGDPIFAADADGKLYFSWINLYLAGGFRLYMAMYWAWSTDGGITWQREKNDAIGKVVMTDPMTVEEAFDKQWLAVDRSASQWRGTLYAAMFHPDTAGIKVAVRRKPPDSAAFIQQSVRVSPPGLKQVQFTSIAVDGEGGVHVTFFASEDSAVYAMYHARSTDGGVSFAAPVKVSDINVPRFSANDRNGGIPGIQDRRIYPAPHLVADVSGGSRNGWLYLVWAANGIAEKGASGMDVCLSVSSDNGATWRNPKVVNDDQPGLPVDQFHPSIAVNEDGILGVSWYDRREDPTNISGRYYFAVSTDGGETFFPNRPAAGMPMDFTRAGAANGGFAIGEYNQLLMNKEYLIPVWADGRNDDGNLDVLAAFIPISSAAGAERVCTVTPSFSLGANHPNPFSASTLIPYKLAAPDWVRITVSDALGRIVAELEDARLEAGEHTATFDASALPSGTYNVAMHTGSGRAMRAVTVVK